MKNNFVASETILEAEWIIDKVFCIYRCSNCEDAHKIKETTGLYPYCGQCGAKMKNPQWIHIEYDWD